jgi:hypothetical protein
LTDIVSEKLVKPPLLLHQFSSVLCVVSAWIISCNLISVLYSTVSWRGHDGRFLWRSSKPSSFKIVLKSWLPRWRLLLWWRRGKAKEASRSPSFVFFEKPTYLARLHDDYKCNTHAQQCWIRTNLWWIFTLSWRFAVWWCSYGRNTAIWCPTVIYASFKLSNSVRTGVERWFVQSTIGIRPGGPKFPRFNLDYPATAIFSLFQTSPSSPPLFSSP